MIKLTNNTISREDIKVLTDWLQTDPKLTMGDQTEKFESAFAEWLGVNYAVFVNSGSSANLLMIYVLKYKYGIRKMAVPALSWATDVAPLMQLGIEPVLIDCNLDDLSLDLDDLDEKLADRDMGAVLSISVLGLIPKMHKLKQICDKHGVYLIEDNCEAMGSQQGQRKLGTWGKMSSFSLYYGHHISTIEGGIITTNNTDLYNLLKMFRSHGWARDVEGQAKRDLRDYWSIDEFSDLYTFYVPGFNLRATDLQALLGIEQLRKLPGIRDDRFENFMLYHEILKNSKMWVPYYAWFDCVSNLAYPVISEYKKDIVDKLRDIGVESRPLIAGSIGTQPFYKEVYGERNLPNANKVDMHGFYVPNHPGLSIRDIKNICEILTNKGR